MQELCDDFIKYYEQVMKTRSIIIGTEFHVIIATDYINGDLRNKSSMTVLSSAIAHWYTKTHGNKRKITYEKLCKLLNEQAGRMREVRQ